MLQTKEINVPIEVTGTITDTVSVAANSSGDGIVLQNNTTATSSNQFHSPSLRLTGQGWKTNGTAASQQSDWIIENAPASSTAHPSSQLSYSYQVAGGGYTQLAYLQCPGGGVGNPTFSLATGGNFAINGTSVLNATTLGSGVTASSLTSLGTLTGLHVTQNGASGIFSVLGGGMGANHGTGFALETHDGGQTVATSSIKQEFWNAIFKTNAWNGSGAQNAIWEQSFQPQNVSSGTITCNQNWYCSLNNGAYNLASSLSSAGTLTLAGGFVGGVSTATIVANATTLGNDFKTYIIPSNSGTSVAVTGPSAVAGQEINIINNDATAATTGIVVPANSARKFVYDGTNWRALS